MRVSTAERDAVLQEIQVSAHSAWPQDDGGCCFVGVSFAMIYYVWGCVDVYGLGIDDRPGVVSNLFVLEETNEAVAWNQVPVRAIYFSVITTPFRAFDNE